MKHRPQPRRRLAEVLAVALAGLLAPKRLFPVLLVAGALVLAQYRFTDHVRSSTVTALAMALTAWLVAPLSWYGLFSSERSRQQPLRRLGLYLVLVSVALLLTGPGLAFLLGIPNSFLTSTPNLFVCWALALVGGWGLGRDIAFEEDLRQGQARMATLEKEAERSQLLALRAHLDPHFLFNTLNAIAEWCREDGVVAEKAVLQLAAMLRTMLEGVRSASWPLARELELMDALILLHQLRDPERLRFKRSVTPGLESITVPPLLFLPLIENAVKHGPGAGHAGEIELSLTATESRLRFALSNPGDYRGPRAGSDGLPTLQRRLAIAYGSHASLSIEGRDGRTTVSIDMPLQTAEEVVA